MFEAFHKYKASEDAKIKAYKEKFKQILEVGNNKKLLKTLYNSEKETYEHLSTSMLLVSRMTGELNTMMRLTSDNIDQSKTQLAGNLEKINKW